MLGSGRLERSVYVAVSPSGNGMRLALVISSLAGGGSERVMATLANAWVGRGMGVTLITLSEVESDVYPVDRRVERIGLDLLRPSVHIGQALAGNWRRLRGIRKAVSASHADIVLSFVTNTNVLAVLACAGTGIPVVISERVSLVEHPPVGLWKIGYRIVGHLASAVVAQTRGGAEWLQRRLGRAVYVIPNPLAPWEPSAGEGAEGAEGALPEIPRSRRTLLAIGRLTPQKGFDLLLDAYARLAPVYPDWTLLILGEGPMRAVLEEQVRRLGLRGRVFLPGFSGAVGRVLREGDAFVLSSRYEGMPNALLEAMAAGLPCVSFDCRTGPSELIENGVNGLLVPAEDAAALAQALGEIMGDTELRRRLGAAAREVQARFGLDRVLPQWQELLAAVAGDRAGAMRRIDDERAGGGR